MVCTHEYTKCWKLHGKLHILMEAMDLLPKDNGHSILRQILFLHGIYVQSEPPAKSLHSYSLLSYTYIFIRHSTQLAMHAEPCKASVYTFHPVANQSRTALSHQ